MTRRKLRLAFVASLAVILAACSATAKSGDTTDRPGAVDEHATLNIAISRQVGNLDPYSFDAIWHAQALIFEPLVQYGEGGTIEPGLAESWKISEDGRTYDFALRPGVTFTDGTPWNSDAAKFGLDQWVGNPRFDFLTAAGAIDSISTPDEMTVRLILKKPFPGLLQELTITRPVRFLSPNAVDSDGKYSEPVGTGPFKLVENTSTETTFERNDDYWGDLPKVEKLVLKVIPDAQARLTALRAGAIDVTGGEWTAPLSPQDAQLIGDDVQLLTEPDTTTLMIAFNDDPGRAAADPAVREAVNLAMDRQAIVAAIFAGFATPAGSLFPASIPNSFATEAPARDLERAKGVLETAGWTGEGTRTKDGRPLRLELVLSNERLPGSRALGEALQSELGEAGIDVVIDDLDHATVHDQIPAREYDIALFTTYGAPYDPANTLNGLFMSTVESGPDGKIYRNAALDPLINEAVEAQTDEAQKHAFTAVYRYLSENHALAPILVPDRRWAFSSRVHDAQLPPTEYEFPLNGLWVSAQ